MDIKDKNNIQNLLDRFRNSSLSEKDINELYTLVNDKSADNELGQYYTELWDSSSKRHSEADSKLILSYVKDSVLKREKINDQNKILPLRKQLNILLRYAAVFLIAFSVAWFGKNFIATETPLPEYNKENIVEVSNGSKSKIQLPDGSFVNLNSGSRLTYPTTFKNGKRDVYLTGEAFFEVEANEEMPFYVHTSDITIKVTGTKFNVKSYPDSESIETTLVTGKLQILNKDKDDEVWTVLSPNETAVYHKTTIPVKQNNNKEPDLKPRKMKEVQVKKEKNTKETYAWKDNQLMFNNQKFKDLAVVMERWYDVKIDIRNDHLSNERFTGKFDTETIEQALDALQLIVPFEYKMDKNDIIILQLN